MTYFSNSIMPDLKDNPSPRQQTTSAEVAGHILSGALDEVTGLKRPAGRELRKFLDEIVKIDKFDGTAVETRRKSLLASAKRDADNPEGFLVFDTRNLGDQPFTMGGIRGVKDVNGTLFIFACVLINLDHPILQHQGTVRINEEDHISMLESISNAQIAAEMNLGNPAMINKVRYIEILEAKNSQLKS